MSVVEKSVDVDVPVRVAYNQWTQFESFPEFMEGVEEIRQLDEQTLLWHIDIGGVDRTFQARIEEQEPDRRIAWRATEGEEQAGVVTFQPVGDAQTRVRLEMTYDPDQWTEKVADFLNIIDRRVQGDLERFKSFVEERGQETGAWRGSVEGGEVAEGDDPSDVPPRGDVGGSADLGGGPHERE